MNKAQYRQVTKWLAEGNTSIVVRIKDRGSNNPYGRKSSKYAGSTMRVVRTTGENRCSLVAHEMNRSISLHYAELILLDQTLPLTSVVRRPDPTPASPEVIMVRDQIKFHKAAIVRLQTRLRECS